MSLRFLFIDDDADDRELFGEALKEVDPTIMISYAADGELARSILQQGGAKPDLIFLDANLPKISGWELLQGIKDDAATCHIPVIMYSTSSYHKDVEIAMSSGATWFFTKPNYYGDLKDMLRIVVESLRRNPELPLKEKIRKATED